MFKNNIESFVAETLANANDNAKANAKVLNSFFIAMAKNGFEIQSVWDGEETEKVEDGNRFQALDIVFGVDDSSVLFAKGDIRVNCSIVLDCTGIETVSDYGIKANDKEREEIEAMLTKIMNDLDK